MSGTSELSRSNIGLTKILIIGTMALCAATSIFAIMQIGGEARAAFERQRANEMASESRALCEKWGMRHTSPTFDECLADIQAIREHHEQRIRQDEEPF